MDFNEQLNNCSNRTQQLKSQLITEESTKTSLIMPFFQMLGYDIFNPLEFCPEYTADVGIKKGEKVIFLHTGGTPGINTPHHRVEIEKERNKYIHII